MKFTKALPFLLMLPQSFTNPEKFHSPKGRLVYSGRKGKTI